MKRSTKAINLILIGSTLILSGCGVPPEDDSGDFGADRLDTGRGRTGSHYHGGSWNFGRSWGGGYSGGGYSRGGGAVSSRGGFGGTGHAVAS